MLKPLKRLRRQIRLWLTQFRYSLSFVDALPQLTFLGLVVGFVTGAIIIAFRLAIEWPLGVLLTNGPDHFEGLPPQNRVGFIFVGMLVLYGIMKLADPTKRQVSVGHVLDRLYNYQGHMPLTNWMVQFFGGIVAIISGQSVGREGPVIHLGAGAASRLATRLRLPNNSRYTLIACGAAAAISASFDTPLAGVIFAMEVILMEYTVVGFVPVILAAVTGSIMSQAVFGNTSSLFAIPTDFNSLRELPFMICVGLVIAFTAVTFIKLHTQVLKLSKMPLALKFAAAGGLMSLVAWYVPEVMGLGYDTLNDALQGQLTIQTLLVVTAAKLIATSVVVGLGVPGGVIGPTLVMGACRGGALGYMAQTLYGVPNLEPEFDVILGMTGMMAAVLNAPMAALVAVLELSYNPNMIFPSMLVIVSACLITRSVFKLEGIFIEQLKHTQRELDFKPAQQALRRAGMAEVLQYNLVYARRSVDYESAKALLANKPTWIVIDFKEQETKDKVAMRAADLATYLEEAPVDVLSLEADIDLLAIPARRLVLSPIHETASLWEALEALRHTNAEALYVARSNNPLATAIRGIVIEEDIRNYYQA